MTESNKIKLIRDYFAPVTMAEIKALTDKDKLELASAISRETGIAAIGFEPVEY